MSLLPFMRQKALEKGIKTCPNCGAEDIFYSLGGCHECHGSIPKNPPTKTLLFSIELFSEFFEKFDELFPIDHKKAPLQFFKGLIYTLKTKGELENEKIIQLQSVLKQFESLGGNEIGGAIHFKNGKQDLQLLKNHSDQISAIKSLGAVLLAINYILEYQVKNEFVIEIPRNNKPTSTTSNLKSNKGCLSSVILLFSILTVLIICFVIF